MSPPGAQTLRVSTERDVLRKGQSIATLLRGANSISHLKSALSPLQNRWTLTRKRQDQAVSPDTRGGVHSLGLWRRPSARHQGASSSGSGHKRAPTLGQRSGGRYVSPAQDSPRPGEEALSCTNRCRLCKVVNQPKVTGPRPGRRRESLSALKATDLSVRGPSV